jgi:hypothetical protein
MTILSWLPVCGQLSANGAAINVRCRTLGRMSSPDRARSANYVRHRTELGLQEAYNVNNLYKLLENFMDKNQSMQRAGRATALSAALVAMLALTACASQKAPATADVAVSRNAVENAVQAGAADLAPAEITAARSKMMRANEALAAKDYKMARELAMQAQADAQLAQSKSNSAKATAASNALNEDLRVLRQEVERANTQ